MTKEYSTYEISDFIGDFGGYLGLLLGGSLPALINLFGKVIDSVVKRFKGRYDKEINIENHGTKSPKF